jgi:hypothetical protein
VVGVAVKAGIVSVVAAGVVAIASVKVAVAGIVAPVRVLSVMVAMQPLWFPVPTFSVIISSFVSHSFSVLGYEIALLLIRMPTGYGLATGMAISKPQAV